jgi:hypothetical protein
MMCTLYGQTVTPGKGIANWLVSPLRVWLGPCEKASWQLDRICRLVTIMANITMLGAAAAAAAAKLLQTIMLPR